MAQFLFNGLVAGFAYALLALSFALIYTPTRFFHFAHGVIYTAGAYFMLTFYVRAKLPFAVALLLAVLATSLLGMTMDLVIYRPLRRKYASGLVLLIASMGLYIALQNVISLVFGDETKTLRGGEVMVGYNILGARITPIQLCIVLASATITTLCWAVIRFTRWGRALRAVANDAELALAAGIDADRVILGAFALGSALAAVAAILVAFDVDMTPTMGMNALMMAVVAMIVGGVGSIHGAALGGVLLGLAQHLGVWKISSQWQDAIAFVILVAFLLVRPQGILGRPLKKVNI